MALGNLGNYEEAAKKFEKAVEFNPDSFEALFWWGWAFGSLGTYEEAAKKFEKAAELKLDSFEAYFNWGWALGNLGNHEEAAKKFEKAVELKPDSLEAYNNWGLALSNLGNSEVVIKKFEKASELNPDSFEVYFKWGLALGNLGNHDEAAKKFEKAAKIKPNDFEAYFRWGRALGNSGSHEEAAKKFEKSVELSPNYGEAYHNWGVALANGGCYEDAAKKYEIAIGLDKENAEIYNHWGFSIVCSSANITNCNKAIEKFKKAVELKQDYHEVYNNMGLALACLGNLEDAEDCYKKAIDLKPNYVDAYYNLGLALLYLKRDSEAIVNFKQVVELNPNYPKAFYYLGIAFFNLGSISEAINRFEQAATLISNPTQDDSEIYFRWGLALCHNFDFKDSIEKFKIAIKLNNSHKLAYYGWGLALSELKDYANAIEKYNRSIILDKTFIHPYYSIYSIQRLCGKFKESYEKIYEVAPNLLKSPDMLDLEELRCYANIQHYALNNLIEAESFYNKGISKDPQHIGILIDLAQLYLDQWKNSEEEEASKYWKAKDLYKNIEELLLNKKFINHRDSIQLAQLYLMFEEYDKAESILKKMIENSNVDYPDIFAKLGVANFGMGNYKDAIIFLRKAMKQAPNDIITRGNLAAAYLKSEFVNEAENEYRQILKRSPGHVESYIGLGRVCVAQGDSGNVDRYEEGIAYFNKSIEVSNSEIGSKKLSESKELSNILYLRGYSNVKFYENSPRTWGNGPIDAALNDFKKAYQLDSSNYYAKRGIRKLEDRLSRFGSSRIGEEIAPISISVMSFATFLLAQSGYYLNYPKEISNINSYIILTFSSLIFLIASFYLPKILKMKVAGIELEKQVSDQLTLSPIGIINQPQNISISLSDLTQITSGIVRLPGLAQMQNKDTIQIMSMGLKDFKVPYS